MKTLRDVFEKVSSVAKASTDVCSEHMQRISAAFGAYSPFTRSEKAYHFLKTAALGSVFLLSVVSFNPEGLVGAGFAVTDEVSRLDEIGSEILKHHHTIT